MPHYLSSAFFSVHDGKGFGESLQAAINCTRSDGLFTGDNLFTFAKNLSFLGNEKFMEAFGRHAQTDIEKGIIWRTYVLCWAAAQGLRREGDFVECGTYKGTSAHIILDYLDFDKSHRNFHLYDLFEHAPQMSHVKLPEHGAQLHEGVCKRFADHPSVKIFKGSVEDTLPGSAPERIAFLHIDMNNAKAEQFALETLYPRVADGAFIVLDDYGWLRYSAQKEVADMYLNKLGHQVLELPTGQGLVIK